MEKSFIIHVQRSYGRQHHESFHKKNNGLTVIIIVEQMKMLNYFGFRDSEKDDEYCQVYVKHISTQPGIIIITKVSAA